MLKKTVLFLASSILLLACGPKSDTVHLEKVVKVSDGQFTLHDQPAVSIYLGTNSGSEGGRHVMEMTLYRKNVKVGYNVQSIQRSHAYELDTEANWKREHHVESSQHDTRAQLIIHSIDNQNRRAIISVFANLVDVSSGQINSFSGKELIIKNENFERFVKNE